MSVLIDDLNIVMRVLIEDGYPSEYANTIANAMYTLNKQANRIKELENPSISEDADCYCE